MRGTVHYKVNNGIGIVSTLVVFFSKPQKLLALLKAGTGWKETSQCFIVFEVLLPEVTSLAKQKITILRFWARMSFDRSNVPARKGGIGIRRVNTKAGLAGSYFHFVFRNIHRISPVRCVGDYWLGFKIANVLEKMKG